MLHARAGGAATRASRSRRNQPGFPPPFRPAAACRATCAGRGWPRARRSGSRARPRTCAPPSPGACARAASRRSRPARRDALLLGGTRVRPAGARGGRGGARRACSAALTPTPRRALRRRSTGARSRTPTAPGARIWPAWPGRRDARARRDARRCSSSASATTRPTSAMPRHDGEQAASSAPAARAADGRARRRRRRRPAASTSRAVSAPEAGDEHVARAGGEEVGHVEPARAAQHARDALLEQQIPG